MSIEDNGRLTEEFTSPETVSALQHAVKVMTEDYSESIAEDCNQPSPFLLHMLYKALMACLKMKHKPPAGLDITSTIHVLKSALKRFRSRWLVAGMLNRSFPCYADCARKSAYNATGTYLLLAKRHEVFSLIQTP
jgi:hypothetical protein